MAFVTIPSGDLDVGDPVKKDIMDLIKSNEDDLNSRLNFVEGGFNKVIAFNGKVANAGLYVSTSTFEGLDIFTAPQAFTLTSAIVTVDVAGTSGTLEIDVQKSTDDGATWTTVFTTKPSVAFGIGDNAASSNATFSVTSVAAGDLLRLDISGFQSPQRAFFVYVIGELS